MSLRAVLIGTSIAGVLVALSFGPALYGTITGRPIYLDCGDASPAQCEEALNYYSENIPARYAGEGPVIYFTFDWSSEDPCPEWGIGRGWFTLAAVAGGTGAEPFC